MTHSVDLPGMINLLKELVCLESPSSEKSAVDRVGAVVARECKRLGGTVTIHPQSDSGDHVQADFVPMVSAPADSGSRILLLCHMDTVFPVGTLPGMPFQQKDERIYGPGVADMKGGIVVTLAALEDVLRSGGLKCPVTALFTSDEETGSRNSRRLIEQLAVASSLVLVLEPGMADGSLKTWRKGVGDFILTARGKAAHAGGAHEDGRNAILEMAHQVIAVQALTDYTKGTSLNVGRIQGGTAINVVPDKACVEIDLRILQPGEAERITAALQALRPVLEGTSLELSGEINRPPMPCTESIKATFDKVSRIAAARGMSLKAGGTGGASDANFVAPLGVPVLDGLGPAGGEFHSEREYILTNSLVERRVLLGGILTDWEDV